jgi:hypothetical protein
VVGRCSAHSRTGLQVKGSASARGISSPVGRDVQKGGAKSEQTLVTLCIWSAQAEKMDHRNCKERKRTLFRVPAYWANSSSRACKSVDLVQKTGKGVATRAGQLFWPAPLQRG